MANLPMIFGHRGAMGYCIENTFHSFQTAVRQGANIETDIKLTKDGILVCFHDSYFKINSSWYSIKKLKYDELRGLRFKDNREIPKLSKVFEIFKNKKNLLYSFDIQNKKVGYELIKLSEEIELLDKIIITDTRMKVLKHLRSVCKDLKLVYTLPHKFPKIENNKVDYNQLRTLNIDSINIKNNKYTPENFIKIIQNGFNCYIWGVNRKIRMKQVLDLRFNKKIVSAIYTDYPDRVIELKQKFNSKKHFFHNED
ncbi:MAG: hypothetical protein GF317_22575 [Candidatus Lokiarchaeota archaeon]|nr:hypothetical protein [Candidatus Lokiarchaeota archaeon]MBD3202247.1 hypothetical protein [Candidatus Lokiarchaeota archaeon]